MKLSSDENFLAENKVLILYILNKVGKPLTNDALLKLVVSTTDMNYFYFQQFLLDLMDSGYIVHYTEEDLVYTLTDKGKEILNLTQNIIPGIVKLKVDSNFQEKLDSIKDELSVSAEFLPESESEYSVKCKIVENNKTLFEIKTFAGSGNQAKQITDNWKKNATQIYPKLLDILYNSDSQ